MGNTVQHRFSLASYHTMHFEAEANYFVGVDDEIFLEEVLNWLPKYQQIFWLGGGSNVIFLQDFAGLVICLNTKGISIAEENNTVLVTAQAGEVWCDFVNYCIENQCYGLENLSLIPGKVGAAPVQNIGAYGVEVKDMIKEVHCIDIKSKQRFVLTNAQCQFAYRSSIFKTAKAQNWIITAVTFKLNKQFQPNLSYRELHRYLAEKHAGVKLTPVVLAQSVCELRKVKLPDPNVFGNVGSFFHNPIVSEQELKQLLSQFPDIPNYAYTKNYFKIAAGWLIEYLGFKGFSVGGMAVHRQQALVIINKNHGTAAELIKLVELIETAVYQTFKIRLTVEPKLI